MNDPPPETGSGQDADDWRPAASWENLVLRSALLKRTRAFFDQREFLEVETPLLSADTTVDRHLDPLSCTLPHDPRQPNKGAKLWLQTSPEFAMKRLMAAGGTAIYQITRAFRAAEHGRLHNPEFTIVEWYQKDDSMEQGIELLSELADHLLAAGPAESISYRDAFLSCTGLDPLDAESAHFAGLAAANGLAVPPDLGDEIDGWRELLLSELVAPQLGRVCPTIICDFPASQAMLAKVRDEDPPVAERFELFYRGVELANGYHELTDGNELRRRTVAANRQRDVDGKPRLPEDSRLMTAMQHGLPACSGVALGFDRVVMLAAGATSLADVMAFPIDRA